MQIIKRSAHAPVGTALVLFLGLAIVPVSLHATGVRISFSPRLAAATDAWQQIAEVFGASYHPAPAAELTVVRDLDADPYNPRESSRSKYADSACAQESRELPATAVKAPEPIVLKASSVRRRAAKSTSLGSFSSRELDIVVAAEAIKASFAKQSQALSDQGAFNFVMSKRGELLKSFNKRPFKPSFKLIDEGGNPQHAEEMKVVLQIRRAVAGSSAKLAERKVFSALASTRNRQCDRAVLTNIPTESLDHSEF